jgi:hypothetical protein
MEKSSVIADAADYWGGHTKKPGGLPKPRRHRRQTGIWYYAFFGLAKAEFHGVKELCVIPIPPCPSVVFILGYHR